MSSVNCNSTSMPRIRAPYPYFNAVIYDRMTACGIPIPHGLPETGRGQWSRSVEPGSDSVPKDLPARTKFSDFMLESKYMNSVRNQCDKLDLDDLRWKAYFSESNRFLWCETLKIAVRELLEDEIATAEREIDEKGLDRFVELVEDAIFYKVARNHAEYGNSMAAKYDSIRGGDFTKEERQLLQQLVWL